MNPVVLVADSDPFNLRLLTEVCQSGGYRVITAHDGESALDALSRRKPDLLLLDIDMSNLGGMDVLRVLRKEPEFDQIPVMIVADSGDVGRADEALSEGAFDSITRPFRTVEVHQRIRNALRLRDAEIRASLPPELGIVDPATHAGTRPQFLVTLDYEFSRSVRYHHALSCLLVEVSNAAEYKAAPISDVFDGMVIELAGGLRRCIRSLDHLFRTDEASFAVLLPETGAEGAQVVVSRVRELCASGGFSSVHAVAELRLSVGLSTYPGLGINVAEDLVEGASKALAPLTSRT